MPGRRCVVEDHGNGKNDLGISIHNSPESGGVRLKWKSFMSMHQKDFDPVGKFDVCSEYFTKDCFLLAFPMKGIKRYLKRGIVPTIWKKFSETLSKRCLSPLVLHLFPHLPVTWFFQASLFNIHAINAMTIWTSQVVACVFILFYFLLIVNSKTGICAKLGICTELTRSQFPNLSTQA